MEKIDGVFVCAVCLMPLSEIAVRNDDPFCTTGCAKAAYGVEIQTNPTGRGTPVGSSS